jgi:hypothetical protein
LLNVVVEFTVANDEVEEAAIIVEVEAVSKPF